MAVSRVEVELARQAHGEPQAGAVGGEARFGLHVARVHADRTPRSPRRQPRLTAPLSWGQTETGTAGRPRPGSGRPDRVQEAVRDAARRGEWHAVEGGKARQHFIELTAVRAFEEDRLSGASAGGRGLAGRVGWCMARLAAWRSAKYARGASSGGEPA